MKMKIEKIFILSLFFLASVVPTHAVIAESALPDLSIVGVSFSPRTPNSGESFSGDLRVEIANNGTVGTSNTEGIWLTVALSSNWSLIQWGYPRGGYIKNLVAGEHATITYPITNLEISGRTIEIRTWIDSGPAVNDLPNILVNENLFIGESNETNNTAVTELRLNQLRNIIPAQVLPDLSITELELQSMDGIKLSRNPLADESFFIVPTISNTGQGVAFFPFSFSFSENNKTLGNVEVKQDLPTNTSRQEKNMYAFSFASTGNHEITFTINPDNKIQENDTTNNTKSFSIIIDPKPEAIKQEELPVSSIPVETIIKPDEYTVHAEMLLENRFTELQAELGLKENKDLENDFQKSFLEPLTKNNSLTPSVKTALLYFISYGVDKNTWALGGGERNAVLLSFKEAFDRLPTSLEDMTDIIKIANGRWPATLSQNAEMRAREDFEKIYKRKADINHVRDNAAITIMAYGLRQKAENRNQTSESKAQATFRKIYAHGPSNTREWNILQAITYSGATR